MLALISLAAVSVLVGLSDPSDAQNVKPRVTLSKETTYVTGPLTKDGYVDYVAALNERMRSGVSPDENANIWFWRAIGPAPEGGRPMPDEFFRLMGMEVPPVEGRYFESLIDNVRRRAGKEVPQERLDAMSNTCYRAMDGPWTATQYPEVAAWLADNEAPLAVVVDGTRRSKYFSPLVVGSSEDDQSKGLIGALLPGGERIRELARALTARAMLRVGQQRPQEAVNDLIAVQRMGRLVARGAILAELLVGYNLEHMAVRGYAIALSPGLLSRDQLEQFRQELQKLPPMAPARDKVNLGERFMYLDSVQLIMRDFLEKISAPAGKDPGPLNKALSWFAPGPVNWNRVMRDGNQFYDRLVAAMDQPTLEQCRKAADEIRSTLENTAAEVGDPKQLLKTYFTHTRSELIAKALLTFSPRVDAISEAEMEIQQYADEIEIACALANYHLTHGRYPERLADLQPQLLAQVPRDRFSQQSLHYQPGDGGYLLYSVGRNGRDDGGREDWRAEPEGDDVGLRVKPLPAANR